MNHSKAHAESRRLVRVFSTPSLSEGLLAKGLLEANGIPVSIKGESQGPYRTGSTHLWVPQEFEDSARLALEQARSAADAGTSEEDD